MDYDQRALQTVREDRFLISNYDAWLFHEFEPFLGQRILEVGCGLGNLLERLLEREIVIGIEPSDEIVSLVRQRFAVHPNILIENYDITEPHVLCLVEKRLDTAISLNVFEHIENDNLALEHVFQILSPGGHLILIVPAHPFLYGRIDAAIGHFRRYTKTRLREKMERVGFQVKSQKYINMLGALGWWVNGTILRKKVPPSSQLRLINTITPILQAVEGVFPAPFGISLLTIAYKPQV